MGRVAHIKIKTPPDAGKAGGWIGKAHKVNGAFVLRGDKVNFPTDSEFVNKVQELRKRALFVETCSITNYDLVAHYMSEYRFEIYTRTGKEIAVVIPCSKEQFLQGV